MKKFVFTMIFCVVGYLGAHYTKDHCDKPPLTAKDCLLLETTIDNYYEAGNEALADQYVAIYDNGGCMDIPVEDY